ncbi:MAG: 3'-5' exonuclease [Gemmatimonadota bacterium]|nr:3'-5' exonuclease [Gemmatimonadota bacterium]
MQEGIRATPQGTLVDRALRFLDGQSADSVTLARDVLGIGRATRAIADRVTVALLGSDPRVRRLRDGRWALAATPAQGASLAFCTFAVVDVETTGSRAGHGDRVTEIAVVTLADGRCDVVLDTLVNPERPIPRVVSAITRITNDMVCDKPTFADIADEVTDALAGRVFVAHNARFDWAFLSRELRRTRYLALEGPRLCTVHMARRLIPGLRSRGLDSVASYFGVEITNRHRAGGDAMATAKILNHLLDLAAEQGATTLEDVRELSRRRRRRKTALPTSVKEI